MLQVLRGFALFLIFVVALIAASLIALFLYLDPQTPSAESYRHLRLETPLRIFSSDGKLIGEFGERRLMPIKLAEMPKQFVQAVIDTEDKRFYEHSGVDLLPFLSVAREFLSTGDGRGASTITMQVARNISLTPERKVIRKLKEMLLALKIEQELTKDEILELYLNMVPYGKRAYGAQAAAMTYYGKPLTELSLAQWAMLAGIPQRPNGNNPINDPQAALLRRKYVLGRMLEEKTIDQAAYRHALEEPIAAQVHSQDVELDARYAAEMARKELFDLYGDAAYSSGMQVELTIDSRMQELANRSIRQGIFDYDRRHGYRGVEAHLGGTVGDAATQKKWREQLLALPAPGGLLPAVVIRADETSFEVMLASGEDLRIERRGFAWARRHIDEERTGGAPEFASQVVRVGDLVRVREVVSDRDPQVKYWALAQLPDIQAAMTALDPMTGEIKALVGGFDFGADQFNHAAQATRQPGSGFKPFVYSAAIEAGVTPSTVIVDGPINLRAGNGKSYSPRNFGGRYYGPVRVREALYRSLNTVSVRLVLKVGAGYTREYLNRFGLDTTNFPKDVQLALGAGTLALGPLQMARGYAAFANGGYLVTPHVIRVVRSNDGEFMYRAQQPVVCGSCERAKEETTRFGDSERPVAPRTLSAANAYIMNSLLADVVVRGTAQRAGNELGRKDLRGKTGTTDKADAWFNGYSPNLVASYWLGFSDSKPIGRRETGSSAALPMWINFMKDALAGVPETELVEPPGIIRIRVDPRSGRPASAFQANAYFEVFMAEHTPELTDDSVGGGSSREGSNASPIGIF